MMGDHEDNNIQEKITKKSSLKNVIADFVHSKNKTFDGDSTKQRIKRALGAYYSMHEGLIYDEGGLPGKPSQSSAPKPDAPATNYWKNHLSNHYILSHFYQHGTTEEKLQAAKELPIAERKMKFWSQHSNFNPKDAQAYHETLKKQWGNSKSMRDTAISGVRASRSAPRIPPASTASKTASTSSSAPVAKVAPAAPAPSKNVVASPKQANSKPMNPNLQRLVAMRQARPTVATITKDSNTKVVSQTSPENSKEVQDFLNKGGRVQKVAKGKTNYRWPDGNPEKKIKESHSVQEDMKDVKSAMPKGAKPLSQILPKPARKSHEWLGNTEDERKIVNMYRDHTVEFPDYNGNGDDVFKGTRVKRAEKPVNPGEDEMKYAEWNTDIHVKEELSPELFKKKGGEPAALTSSHGPEKISSRHLDYHWATKYAAKPGDTIKAVGNDAHITSTEPDTHETIKTVITDGARHISQMPKGTYDSKDGNRTDANSGKYNVVRTHKSSDGYKSVHFVSSKKDKDVIGNQEHTTNESDAKEFKNYTHAQNHSNLMNRHHEDYGNGETRWQAYPKRDASQVKSWKSKWKAAAKEHTSALEKNGFWHLNPEVQKAHDKMQSFVHPAYNSI